MALRDGRSAGRMLGGGGLDTTQRRNARQVQNQLGRNTRHNLGSRKAGLRIGTPAPTITSIVPPFGSMAGGYTVTIYGDYFDVDATNFVSPQGVSGVTGTVILNEQTLTTVWGSANLFGQIDVYVYNNSLTLSSFLNNCFRYQPFEQVDATLFFRADRYSVTGGGGTWQSSETGGPSTNYYPATAASNAPVASGRSPTFTTGNAPLVVTGYTSGLWYGAADHHCIAVVDLTEITSLDTDAVYDRQAVFCDNGGNAGLHFHRAGVFGSYTYWADYFEFDAGSIVASVEITSFVDATGAGRVVVQGKKEGGYLHVRVGSGAWVTSGSAIGAWGSSVNDFQIGTTYDGTVALKGTIRALGVYAIGKDNATFSDLIADWAEVAFPVTKVKLLDLDSRFVTLNIGDPTLVDSWQDQSGNGYDAVAAPGEEATYVASHPGYGGVPAVEFPFNDIKHYDTSDAIAALIGADPVTMFVVGNVDDLAYGGNAYFVMTKSGPTLGIFSQGLQFWSPYAGGTAPYTDYTNVAVRGYVASVFTGGDTSRFYQSSVIPKTHTSYQGETTRNIQLEGANINAGFRIGQWQGPAVGFTPAGPILRVVIYKGALNQAQIEEVFYDFETTYGVLVQDETLNTVGLTGKWTAGNYDDTDYNDYFSTNFGTWFGEDTRGATLGQDWITTTGGTTIPALNSINALANPLVDGTDDYMSQFTTNYPYKTVRTIDEIFAPGGGAGTIIAGLIPYDAPAYVPGTLTAQSPYDNDGIVVDTVGYMGLHWSDGGFTAGLYDATPRDVGGGLNDGWQMATVAATVSVPNIAIMRWNGTVLEIAANATAGVITWVTVDAGAISYRLGTLRLGSNYSLGRYANADFGAVRTYNRYLSDAEINEAGYDIQTTLGWSQGFTLPAGTSPIDAEINSTSTVIADLTAEGAMASTIVGTSTTSANLVGQGTITATTVGTSTITAALLGSADAVSTIPGASTTTAALLGAGTIVSTISSASTITAVLTASGALASTTAGVSTISAALLGRVDAASTIPGVSTINAALLGEGAIASTTAGASTTQATLSLSSTISGTSTTAANLVGSGAIASTSAGVSATTAVLTAILPADATIASSSTITGNLLGDGAVASTIPGVSTTTSALLANGALVATVPGTSILTANLLASGAMASTTAGVSNTTATLSLSAIVVSASTVTANLTASGALTATAANASTTTAVLTGAGAVASTIAGTSTIDAVGTANASGASTIAGTSTTSANLLGAGALTSTIANSSTVIATLDLHAQVSGTSTVTANLTATGTVVSTSSGTSTTTAALVGEGAVTSTISGASTTTAGLLASGALTSSIAGTSTVAATVSLSSTVAGVSTTTASLIASGALVSTVSGASTTAATLSLSSTVNGTSTTSANLTAFGELASTSASTSTVDATGELIGYLLSTVDGISTTAANLLGDGALNATIDGTGTCSLVSVEGEMSARCDSTSAISASITGNVNIASTTNSNSTISGDLIASGALSSTTSSSSAVNATLIAAASIASTVSSTSTVAANLIAQADAASSIAGVSTITGVLVGEGSLAATNASASTIVANMVGEGAMASTIAGTSSLTVVADDSIAAQIDGSSTVIATLTGQAVAQSQTSSVSTVTANLIGAASAFAQINQASTTVATLNATANISSSSAGVSTISANLISSADSAATAAGTSAVSAQLTGQGALAAQVVESSTTTASLKGTGNVTSQIDGTSTVAADISYEAPAGAISATVSSSATVLGMLVGNGQMFAISSNSANVTAIIETFDPSRVNINAIINGTSTINAYIVNYLADKLITDIDLVTRSAQELDSGFTPTIISRITTVTPVVDPPVIVSPAIVSSGTQIATPIFPALIVKDIPTPIVEPTPEPAIDLSINSSGIQIAAPILPVLIVEAAPTLTIEPTPEPISDPSITSSGVQITTPISPALIVEVAPTPMIEPEPEPVDDTAIDRSGETLATPIVPRRIIKSNNSIN